MSRLSPRARLVIAVFAYVALCVIACAVMVVHPAQPSIAIPLLACVLIATVLLALFLGDE